MISNEDIVTSMVHGDNKKKTNLINPSMACRVQLKYDLTLVILRVNDMSLLQERH